MARDHIQAKAVDAKVIENGTMGMRSIRPNENGYLREQAANPLCPIDA
jgi:hypothetical protein